MRRTRVNYFDVSPEQSLAWHLACRLQAAVRLSIHNPNGFLLINIGIFTVFTKNPIFVYLR